MKEVFLSESYSVIKKLSGEEGLKYIEENDPVTVVIFRLYHERDEWTGVFKASLSY